MTCSRHRSLLLWVLLLGLSSAHALTVDELVTSIKQSHPALQAAQARSERAHFHQDEAAAAFDTRLEQQTQARPSGYYDGLYLDQAVIKPLQFMNAEVFGRYRISDGDFPVYEADMLTLDQGEASLGIKLSLLQNRDTDKRRLAVNKTQWKTEEARSKQNATLNKLIYAGVNEYVDWYQALRELQVAEELVMLTEQRLKGIEARYQNGDLPQISVTEYRSTLLSRRVSLRQAEQKVALAKRKLLFYWRPQNDTPQYEQTLNQPPDDIGWRYAFFQPDAQWQQQVLEQHPEIKALRATLRQAENDRRLARNETLPVLDLEMKLAHDLGDGPNSLDQTEGMVALAFSMPIGQRAARAREQAASAQMRSYEWEIQLLESALERDLDIGMKAHAFARDLSQLSAESRAVADQLLQQELKRFEQGASDQFLLLNREKRAVEARLKQIEAECNVLRVELDLAATAGELIL